MEHPYLTRSSINSKSRYPPDEAEPIIIGIVKREPTESEEMVTFPSGITNVNAPEDVFSGSDCFQDPAIEIGDVKLLTCPLEELDSDSNDQEHDDTTSNNIATSSSIVLERECIPSPSNDILTLPKTINGENRNNKRKLNVDPEVSGSNSDTGANKDSSKDGAIATKSGGNECQAETVRKRPGITKIVESNCSNVTAKPGETPSSNEMRVEQQTNGNNYPQLAKITASTDSEEVKSLFPGARHTPRDVNGILAEATSEAFADPKIEVKDENVFKSPAGIGVEELMAKDNVKSNIKGSQLPKRKRTERAGRKIPVLPVSPICHGVASESKRTKRIARRQRTLHSRQGGVSVSPAGGRSMDTGSQDVTGQPPLQLPLHYQSQPGTAGTVQPQLGYGMVHNGAAYQLPPAPHPQNWQGTVDNVPQYPFQGQFQGYQPAHANPGQGGWSSQQPGYHPGSIGIGGMGYPGAPDIYYGAPQWPLYGTGYHYPQMGYAVYPMAPPPLQHYSSMSQSGHINPPNQGWNGAPTQSHEQQF